MRILIFIHSLGIGGAERVAVNLANHWAGMKWEVVIVTLATQGDDFYALHPDIHRIALGKASESRNAVIGVPRNLGRVRSLRRVLRQWSPDIALSMMNTANVLLALAALRLPIRLVGSEHIHPPCLPLGMPWEALRRWTYGLLDAVTALTSESSEWLKIHTNARKVEVIPNAVPWPIPACPPGINPLAILSPEKKWLIAVGRLEPQKGFDLLIEAFSRIAKCHPEWNVVILGEGSRRITLERLVHTYSLENRIYLPGRVGNVADWYAAASLFVMSSRFEGFPNTLVEAMACGLPVVSFDCDTGPRDIIQHEVDGLLVPAGEVGTLAAALSRLMSNEILRDTMAKRARGVRERFSINAISARWCALFEGLLGSASSAGCVERERHE